MFQPQPTPFASFAYGFDIGNAAVAAIPDYNFQPTPLGQLGGGGEGGGGGNQNVGHGASRSNHSPVDVNVDGVGLGGRLTATNLFTSPIFPQNTNNNSNHLPYHSTPQNNNKHDPPPQQRERHRQLQNRRRHVKMEQHQQNSDIARQEAAARDYKPELEGSLVGDKIPSHAITAEYAKADPIYVAKTMALPQTFSHYRPIQGDGNCGWRAIMFSYIETLIRSGDISRIQQELVRLGSLNEYMEGPGGQERYVFEDMVADTLELIKNIVGFMSEGQDPMPILVAKFNEPDGSQTIIYHARFLATAWLNGNQAQYQPWIPGDVGSYIQDTLMPVNREIDHLGVILLYEILLKPAGMVLEIAYLDRSEGSEVNFHRMSAEADGQDPSTLGPVISLLYRPGHYDILYRDAQMLTPPVPSGPVSLQVNRATFTHNQDIQHTMPLGVFSNLDMGPLSMIPGFDNPGLSPLASPMAAPSPMADMFAPSPQQTWVQQQFPEMMPHPPAQQPSPPQRQVTPPTTHPLRFSKYNFPNLVDTSDVSSNSTTSYETPFTTSTFKNSHFNVAHYNNMNFQPEMYKPDADEEQLATGGRSGGRKRSTESCGTATRKRE